MLWLKLAGLVLLLLGAGLCFATLNALWRKPRLAGGFVNPGIAIQFARSAADVESARRDVPTKDLLNRTVSQSADPMGFRVDVAGACRNRSLAAF